MSENFQNEFKEEVHKQAKQQAAKWTILLISLLVGFATTGWWFYLKPKIDTYILEAADGIPTGAVVAFLSSESEPCPGKSWKLFDEAKGRFIVGAGHADRSLLTPRKLGDLGGEENVGLAKEHLPTHTHGKGDLSVGYNKKFLHSNPKLGTLLGPGGNLGIAMSTSDESLKNEGAHNHQLTGFTDGGAGLLAVHHENMPPFIALYFCKKV